METQLNGLNINYFLKGEGNLVVLLHGWGSNITLFNSMADVLAQKYRVLAMDMPGFGKSDEPEAPWDVENYVDFVIDFLKPYYGKKITFLGHSFGGRVIIKMFEKQSLPFEINKLILVDSAGVKPKKTFRQNVKLYTYKATKSVLMSKPVIKIFPDAIENLRKKNGSADYNAASPVMRQTLVKVVNEDLTHLFSRVTPPTLLVWGRNDTATPLSDGYLMEKLMKDAGIVVLNNSGHYSFLEEQVTFNKVLASFMNIN